MLSNLEKLLGNLVSASEGELDKSIEYSDISNDIHQANTKAISKGGNLNSGTKLITQPEQMSQVLKDELNTLLNIAITKDGIEVLDRYVYELVHYYGMSTPEVASIFSLTKKDIDSRIDNVTSYIIEEFNSKSKDGKSKYVINSDPELITRVKELLTKF